MVNYYSMLGVPNFAPPDAVKAAYMEQIKFFHPDVFPGAPEVALMKTQQLNEAYGILKDAQKREQYNEALRREIEFIQERIRREREASGAHTSAPPPPPHVDYEPPRQPPTAPPYEPPARKNFFQRHTGPIFCAVALVAFMAYGFIQGAGDPKVPNATHTPVVVSHYNPTIPPRITIPPEPPITLRPVDVNRNGHIFYSAGSGEALAPLEIKTSGSGYYYVKLRDAYTDKVEMIFFVHGGKTAEVDVPLGTYTLSYAYGKTWYGRIDLFGPDTVYSKADDIFEFYEDGEYYQGWTIELYKSYDGNLDMEPISADEF